MSSFVIDKIEFVKAAGLMYGFENNKREKHIYFLNVVYDKFIECWRNNIKSVCKQYNEDESVYEDNNNYKEVFEKYRKVGAKIFMGLNAPMTRHEFAFSMMSFFNSVLYQIEDDDLHNKCAAFFFTCTTKLFEIEIRKVDGWWGRVDI